MNIDWSAAEEGDLRVWYIPQVPMKAYLAPVPRREGSSDASRLELAVHIQDVIVGLSIFEFDNKVKPDYSDATGIEVYSGGEWVEYDEEDLPESRLFG